MDDFYDAWQLMGIGRSRRMGKSTAMKAMEEAELNAGKVVLCVTGGVMVKKKRFKHLTLMETIHYFGHDGEHNGT